MKSKLSMIFFILILGSVLTTALVSVDNLTRGPIARNKAKKIQLSILSALGITFSQDSIINNVFSENVQTLENNQTKYYKANASGNIAFGFQGMGLWGPIYGTIALSPDLERIQGISITHQEETPGLGARIAEDEFLNQFKGKNVTGKLIITPQGKAVKDNEVDGITGATLSCNAFELILNAEIAKYVLIIKEGK